MQRQALIVGNWKMHGSVAFSQHLAAAVRLGLETPHGASFAGEVVLCPPFTALWAVQASLGESRVRLGGQNMAEQTDGPFTGETSAVMLHDVGCRYVIVGHSERRTLFGETDTMVARKMVAAGHAGLIPIVCLGESLPERAAGRTLDVIASQLAVLFSHLPTTPPHLVLAYEPVWAIGTGHNATVAQIAEVHHFIRQQVHDQIGATTAASLRILYGGSVKAGNAAAIFSLADVDGGLIGGASLNATEFLAIVNAFPEKLTAFSPQD